MFVTLSLILALRDLNVIRFPMPQRRCQAPHQWFHEYDFGSTLFMWGVYIGLGVSSFIKFGGLYAVILSVMITNDPFVAIMTTVSFSLGRTLPVWLAPRQTGRWSIREVAFGGHSSQTVYRILSASTLMWSGVVGLILAVHR